MEEPGPPQPQEGRRAVGAEPIGGLARTTGALHACRHDVLGTARSAFLPQAPAPAGQQGGDRAAPGCPGGITMSDGKLRGKCLCGAVQYEVEGEPEWVAHCHCSLCRRHHGAAYGTYAGYPPARFRLTAGEAEL